MGNTASTEGPRRAPHKLSKPRVGNPASTTNLLSPNASAANPTGRFSNSYLVGSLPVSPADKSKIDLNDAVPEPVVSGEPVEGGPVPTRRLSRRDSNRLSGLFRSKSSNSAAELKRRSTGPADSIPGDSISRTHSMANLISVPPLTRTGSVHYDMNSYEAQRLLNTDKDKAQEPPLPDQENSLDVQEVTETIWKNAPLQPPVSAPLSRANSDLSLYAPMRRRSIVQTPGVATRAKPPASQPSAKSSFRNSHPPTPSESRRNSIETNTSRHLSMPALPVDFDVPERVATPSEADYRQLGGMRFGSLRIMNGAPVPSPARERETRDRRMTSPDESPTRQSFAWNTAQSPFIKAGAATESAGELKIAQPKPTRNAVASDAALMDHSQIWNSKDEVKFSPNDLAGKVIADQSSLSSPSAPLGLQATSKQSEHDDHLFDDDNDDVPESPVAEGLHMREDPLLKLKASGKTLEAPRNRVKSVLSPDSGVLSTPSDKLRKPLSKVDSGYSSIISLRSIRGSNRKPREMESAAHPSKSSAVDTTESPLGSSSSSTANSESNGEPPLAVKTNTPPIDEQAVAGQNAQPASRGIIRLPSLMASKTPESQASSKTGSHSRSKSVDDPLSLDPSEASVSRQSSGKSADKRGKLHRLLSSARRKSMPTPYATHDVDEAVPSIPADVETKLHERNGRFPTAPKRLALRVEPSQETLNTIVSVESVDAPVEIPVYVPQPAEAAPPKSRRRSLQTMSNSISHASRNLMGRKSTQGLKTKSSFIDMDDDGSDGIQDDEAHITSMDNIRHIMGHSAFDQAFISMANDRAAQQSAAARPARAEDHQMPPRSLKSPRSAPNLSGVDMLSPLIPGGFPQRKDRLSPPVSMRTRSSKNLRSSRPPPARSNTSPASQSFSARTRPRPQFRPGSAPNHHGGPMSPALFDPSAMPPHPSIQGQRPQQHRISYEGHVASTRSPPPSQMYSQDQWVNEHHRAKNPSQYGPDQQPRQAHQRHGAAGGSLGSTDELNAPFRVLHSYNSPAYRGVPIWG